MSQNLLAIPRSHGPASANEEAQVSSDRAYEAARNTAFEMAEERELLILMRMDLAIQASVPDHLHYKGGWTRVQFRYFQLDKDVYEPNDVTNYLDHIVSLLIPVIQQMTCNVFQLNAVLAQLHLGITAPNIPAFTPLLRDEQRGLADLYELVRRTNGGSRFGDAQTGMSGILGLAEHRLHGLFKRSIAIFQEYRHYVPTWQGPSTEDLTAQMSHLDLSFAPSKVDRLMEKIAKAYANK